MTIRTKTIEHAFAFSSASVASAAARTFTAATVYMPETTSRFIRSAHLEIHAVDAGTTAASITAVAISIQIGAVGADTATVTQTIANSGENQGFQFVSRSLQSYFVTNFTGASHTVTPVVTITGMATQNASCKLVITYDYDDAPATTRIRTVKIPIDGNTGNLTTSNVNLGGVATQIPNLDTFLPEASKVYRNIFFEWNTHTGTSAAASSTLDILYNATTVSDLTHAHTLVSDIFYRRIDVIGAIINTAATNALGAKATSATAKPCPCLCGVLVVTYEYDHSTSTRVMNSLEIPLLNLPSMPGGSATANKDRIVKKLMVQEPGTITLVQSGVMLSFTDGGAVTVDLRCGAQASRTFAHGATVRGGSMTCMRRIDSGAVGGAGMTLARGENSLTVDLFTTATTVGAIGSAMSGVLYLNYTSDKHASGDGVHNHTITCLTCGYVTGWLSTSTGGKNPVTVLVTPSIDEALYYVTSIGYEYTLMPSTGVASISLANLAEIGSGEGAGGDGWVTLYSGFVAGDGEIAPYLIFADTSHVYRLYPSDPRTNLLALETTVRSHRYDNSLNFSTSVGMIWQAVSKTTYHAISYAIAGSITGSAGGTVTINAYRTTDGMKIGQTTRVGNGAYSIPWYDNTVNVYADAYEDGTHLGRTANGVAV